MDSSQLELISDILSSLKPKLGLLVFSRMPYWFYNMKLGFLGRLDIPLFFILYSIRCFVDFSGLAFLFPLELEHLISTESFFP